MARPLTDRNVQELDIEPNDSGTPTYATWRDDGFWVARGLALDDSAANTIEATITDKADNSTTYPVSPAEHAAKLDRDLNVTYEYDAVGNIKKKTQAIAYGGGASTTYITRYFFDNANRIEYIDYDWTTTADVHYVYDPTGQRVEIRYGEITLSSEDFSSFSPSSARGFVCMGGSILEEWTVSAGATSSHTDDSLNALAYRYVRNPATDLSGGIGSIAYQIDGSDYRYYHYNHKGDTGALTDADTDIIAWYEYDAWGNVVVEWQLPTNVGEGINGVENEFRYSTKQWDATPADATGTAPDAGLLYFGARSLDPSLGRWTQLDPAGTVDGLNMYLYAQNWPIAFVDPLGLDDRPSSDLFYHHKPRKCRDGTYDPVLCAENIAKAFDIAGCLTGRITYGIAYFGGFDAGHRQAIEQLWTMFQDCGKAIKNTCCKPPNPPVPVPEPVISPEPVPVPVVQPAPRRVPAPPPWYQRAWDAAWDAGAAAVDFVADNAVPVIAVGGAGVLIGADILLGGPTGEGIVPATGLLKWGFSR